MQINHIKTLKEHPSSNKYIKDNKKKSLENTLVRVINQTAGVGRRGTPWKSTAKLDLTFSFFVVVDKQKHNQVFMATILALHNVLSKYKIQSFTKLPNDIYVNDKKIAGILMEATHHEHHEELIVGVGLNVNEVNPYTHDSGATSMLYENKDNPYNLEGVLNDFIENYNTLIAETYIFEAFKETIPFEKMSVMFEGKPCIIKSMDENFNCFLEKNDQPIFTPCTNLTFKVKNK